jgi:hypothetical protein
MALEPCVITISLRKPWYFEWLFVVVAMLCRLHFVSIDSSAKFMGNRFKIEVV